MIFDRCTFCWEKETGHSYGDSLWLQRTTEYKAKWEVVPFGKLQALVYDVLPPGGRCRKAMLGVRPFGSNYFPN